MKRGRTEMEASDSAVALNNPAPTIPDQPAAVLGVTSSYKDMLMNQTSHTNDETMEEGEIPEEDYASDDDVFQERLEGPSILLTKEDKRRIRTPWKSALIIKLRGRNIVYTYLFNRLQQIWSLKGSIQVIDLDYGYYSEIRRTITLFSPGDLGSLLIIIFWEVYKNRQNNLQNRTRKIC